MAPQSADLVSEKTEPAVELRDAAAEANHRIANNLTIIAEYVRSEVFSLAQEEPPDVMSIKRSLQRLSLRIDAIGRLHRLLTSSSRAGSVEISMYMREIAEAARCSFAHPERMQILFSFDSGVLVTAKQAIAIGAIASEALINSIKYAHPDDEPGEINIDCRRTSCNGLIVEVKDDGVGRAPEFPGRTLKYSGSGTDLMQALAHSLNATLEIVDAHPGHIVRLELPPGQVP